MFEIVLVAVDWTFFFYCSSTHLHSFYIVCVSSVLCCAERTGKLKVQLGDTERKSPKTKVIVLR